MHTLYLNNICKLISMTTHEIDYNIQTELTIAVDNNDINRLICSLESADFDEFITKENKSKNEILSMLLKNACNRGYQDLIKILLEHIDKKYVSYQHLTDTIRYVCLSKVYNLDIIHLFDDYKSLIGKYAEYCYHIMINPIQYNRIDIIKLVLEREDINLNIIFDVFSPEFFSMVREKTTVLLYACYYKTTNLDTIKFLLDEPRVDPNMYMDGLTIFQQVLKRRNKYDDVIELLANHPRVDIHKRAQDGRTTLDIIQDPYGELIKKYF